MTNPDFRRFAAPDPKNPLAPKSAADWARVDAVGLEKFVAERRAALKTTEG